VVIDDIILMRAYDDSDDDDDVLRNVFANDVKRRIGVRNMMMMMRA